MLEPHSITATSLDLRQLSINVVLNIYEFFKSTKAVDSTLSSLATQIGSLSSVLQTISETAKIAAAISPHASGPLELTQYWENVMQTMDDCTQTLKTLEEILTEVRGEKGQILERTRSQILWQLRGKGIDFCKNQIEGYCQTMQLSLQLLSLYNPDCTIN
jgi:hypothetical protein